MDTDYDDWSRGRIADRFDRRQVGALTVERPNRFAGHRVRETSVVMQLREWLRRMVAAEGRKREPLAVAAKAETVVDKAEAIVDKAEAIVDEVDPFNPFPEPVRLEITDIFDLHTIAPRDVKRVVEEYLREAHEAGFGSVRIIHGKGRGVQREMVRTVLKRTPFVRGWTDAPPEAGGWGATLVLLTPAEDEAPE
jgi:hypothetical protein